MAIPSRNSAKGRTLFYTGGKDSGDPVEVNNRGKLKEFVAGSCTATQQWTPVDETYYCITYSTPH